ncbi:hypothetical protein GOB58_02660 [Acetobacter thailandicus]|nr:hypothetical protein [Acetobacter thailandicus]
MRIYVPCSFALIHNPQSRRNVKTGLSASDVLRALPDLLFCAPETEAALVAALADIAPRKIKYLIVDGGDGTVSKVLSVMHASGWPKEEWPVLIVLPSGNTNLVAEDVGFGLRGEAALKQLVLLAQGQMNKCSVVRRRPLVVSWPDGSHVSVLGFFGGLGAFTRGIEIAHRPGFLKTFSHEAAVICAFLLTVLKLLAPHSRKKWLDGSAVDVTLDGVPAESKRHFLMLFTALRRFPHGVWPFWQRSDSAEQGVVYLDVAAHPERLTTAVFNLLRNRIPSWIRQSPSYNSGLADKISLRGEPLLVLDGEILQTSPEGGFEIEAGPEVSFLQFSKKDD